MLISFIHRWLTGPTEKFFSARNLFWFSLSLIFAIINIIVLVKAGFNSEYAIQEDARFHVTWLLRFWQSSLFPQDFIGDYFLSSLPAGYTALYRTFASLGINPILLSKLLPIPLLLLTTSYGFVLARQLLPVPAVGFIFTVLLNQKITGVLLSGSTPRAFGPLLFLAFLYYLLRRSFWPCLVTIVLQGLFYPPYLLVSGGILVLRLLRWRKGWPHPSLEPSNFLLCGAGLVVTFLVLLPYVLSSSEYGPMITVAQAKSWPQFQTRGSVVFFGQNWWNYWFASRNSRSSLQLNWLFSSQILFLGLFLPILLRYPSRFPLANRVTSATTILSQIIFVSLFLFFLAHALLFKLYLPSRYAHSLLYVICLASAMTLIIVVDAFICFLEKWVSQGNNKNQKLQNKKQILAQVIVLLLAIIFLLYPSRFLNLTSTHGYNYGMEKELYQFLAQQPKDILIASLSNEASNLPSFAQRSVLAAPKFDVPYELGYYNQFRSRVTDSINSQYSDNLEVVKTFINKYGIDFWLLDKGSLTSDYVRNNSWLKQFQPATEEALQKLEQGSVPVLTNLKEQCTVFENEKLLLLEAKCILQSSL
ncbi:MAG: hypothetical protein O9276_18305 [Microcystis sp. LE17-20A]|uniref:hypothetical protein n=1 Tax=Microcystis TaxID=1125 RepID=UPI0016808930|nr:MULTISPECIES: hypothetical protein [Microcystis]MBD2116982.1 hypothetical protein [Microcystis wesenbergii FACHB-1339]MCZ8040011.1 hypothetical protein [Microcystis sp. LE17-20A]MCZ8212781.1 hypothetical protein [Microcystis sp. LE19-8.1F]